MRIRSLCSIPILGLFLFSFCGCGGSDAVSFADLVPVKGKVTYNGKPLTKGTIEFEPRGKGRTATGDIKPDGTYVLRTMKDGDGAATGKHRVSISGTGTGKKELIPQKYATLSSSGLEAEVSPEKTEFDFNLTK